LIDGPITNAQLDGHLQLVLADPEQRMATVSPGSPLGARHWLFADQRTRLDYLVGGFGWCAVPYHLVADHLAAGHLKSLSLQRLAGGHLSIGLHVIHRRALRPGKVARWLIDDLRAGLAEHPMSEGFGSAVPVGMVPRGGATR
jgi:DNA-binding transcriptional LysR family regulator